MAIYQLALHLELVSFISVSVSVFDSVPKCIDFSWRQKNDWHAAVLSHNL